MTDKHKPLAEMKREWEQKHGRPFPGRGKSAPAAAPAAAAAPAPATPEQVEAVRQALAVRYSGMVHAYAVEHKCTKAEAMIQINKTKSGAQARMAYLENANPHIEGGFIEQTPEAPKPAAGPYTGPDFQSLIESYRTRKNCGYVVAYTAVLRTPQGQAAHKAFLKAKNPGINFE